MTTTCNKNPYELRYEIYQQASGRLMDKYYQEHSMWQDFVMWQREFEAEGGTVTAVNPIKVRPGFPTHENILEEAEKIYDFVKDNR